jgi:hypothetical protein
MQQRQVLVLSSLGTQQNCVALTGPDEFIGRMQIECMSTSMARDFTTCIIQSSNQVCFINLAPNVNCQTV